MLTNSFVLCSEETEPSKQWPSIHQRSIIAVVWSPVPRDSSAVFVVLSPFTDTPGAVVMRFAASSWPSGILLAESGGKPATPSLCSDRVWQNVSFLQGVAACSYIVLVQVSGRAGQSSPTRIEELPTHSARRIPATLGRRRLPLLDKSGGEGRSIWPGCSHQPSPSTSIVPGA